MPLPTPPARKLTQEEKLGYEAYHQITPNTL